MPLNRDDKLGGLDRTQRITVQKTPPSRPHSRASRGDILVKRERTVVPHTFTPEPVRQTPPPTPRAVPSVQKAPPRPYHRSPTPYVQGQKPDGFQGVWKDYRIHQVPYYLPPRGPVGSDVTQQNAAQVAETAQFRQQEIGTPGVILRDVAESLVPKRSVEKLGQGKLPSAGDVGADVVTAALDITPGADAAKPLARAGVDIARAIRTDRLTPRAVNAIRVARGEARAASEDAAALKRHMRVAKAEHAAGESPIVSPIRDQIEQAMRAAPGVSNKQIPALMRKSDVTARAVAHAAGITPEQAYEAMWSGAKYTRSVNDLPQPVVRATQDDPMLTAAAMQAKATGDIPGTAKMFGVDEQTLTDFVNNGLAAEEARMYSNADVGAGAAATTENAQTILDRAITPTSDGRFRVGDNYFDTRPKAEEFVSAMQARKAQLQERGLPNDLLPQEGDMPHEGFQNAASEEMKKWDAMARDVQKNLPPSEWPAWVRNNLRAQQERGQFEADKRAADAMDAGIAREDAGNVPDTFPTDWLTQPDGSRIKAAVEKTPEGKYFLHLFERADASSVVHELAHALQRFLPEADKALLARHGLDDPETFARSWERYFMEGKSPVKDPELEHVFSKVGTAMQNVYRNVEAIPGAKMNDEIRGAFDRFISREGQYGASRPGSTAGGTLAQDEMPPDESLANTFKPVSGLTPAEEAKKGLKGARSAYGKQKKGYTPERSARFDRADAIMRNENLDPLERHRLAKEELRGELPKIDYKGFSELDDDALRAMITEIQDHPTLLTGQKIRAVDALQNAVEGRVPTPSQITLLEHVFGKATAKGIRDFSGHPYRDAILDILNIPRSLMSSFDLSAPFRQGIVAGARHPRMFFRNFEPMVKSMASPEHHRAIEQWIHEHPNYPLAMEGRLAITDFESLSTREERFFSRSAERITGGKYGPVAASSRAYVTFLNKMRMDMFNYHLERAAEKGVVVTDQKFLRDLSEVINSATGRGGGGEKFERSAAALNTFLFSPRLLKSRLNFLWPPWYFRLHKYARRLAARSFLTLGAEATSLLGLIALGTRAKVEVDPRNPDWGKIKIGNTRIDIAGGFQQPIRLAAQIFTGTSISSTTGKKKSLRSGKFGDPTELDMIIRFFQGKESPIASFVTDYFRGTDPVGNKFEWDREAYQRMVPLLAQDVYDLYTSGEGGPSGIGKAAGAYAIGGVGFGIQTYKPKDPAANVTKQMVSDAKKYGIDPPGPHILEQLGHKAKLQQLGRDAGKGYLAKVLPVAKYYAEVTGDKSTIADAKSAKDAGDEADAKAIYDEIFADMTLDLADYEKDLHAAEDEYLAK